jgi:hypothetical protein
MTKGKKIEVTEHGRSTAYDKKLTYEIQNK